MNNIGVYVHVPFCISKCPYCDFYSLKPSDSLMDAYTDHITAQIRNSIYIHPTDTVYFGGGTPSILGASRILRILDAIDKSFVVLKGAEITAEVNPADDLESFLKEIKVGGINRLSIGMQSSNNNELKLLGRRHKFSNTERVVSDASKAGFDNISLDLILAASGQTKDSILKSILDCARLGASHVSSYLLKIEEGTPYSKIYKTLSLPDDDTTADYYLFACDALKQAGFYQYEISNFAKPLKESRHNNKYWHCEEYIGFGPSAYSFVDGRRFHYERNIETYLSGASTIDDGTGGDIEEYSMLALRLCEGITLKGIKDRFGTLGETKFAEMAEKAKKYIPGGFVDIANDKIALTKSGFIVSNSLICEII